MKLQTCTGGIFLALLLLFTYIDIQAQPKDFIFKEPMLKIDFGTESNTPGLNVFPLRNYQPVKSTCPDDGNYSFVSNTSNCFNGDWLTFNEDHTPGDENGKMMLVNASPDAGIFFNTILTNINGQATYEISAWLVNVCRISGGCEPLPPNITMKLLTSAGREIASFQTGLLSQTANPHWRVYSGLFSTPADVTTLILTMEDITRGGCGNDFALDDITLREVVKSPLLTNAEAMPLAKPVEKPVTSIAKPEEKKVPAVTKAAVEKTPVISSPVKDTPVTTIKKTVIDSPEITSPVIPQKQVLAPAPKPILTRANPLIKQIETEAGEIEINLYDNGEIDDDTVSVYRNNELIVSKARLSSTPVTFRIKVDATHPYHELIMVANNLGSIPPNTSMMIITTGNKRYEVFISSSEQKNAKIVIGLKE